MKSCSYTNTKNAFESYIDVETITIAENDTRKVLDLSKVTESAKMQAFTLASNIQDMQSTEGFPKAQKLFSINYSDSLLSFNKDVFKELDAFTREEAVPQTDADIQEMLRIMDDNTSEDDSWTEEDIEKIEEERRALAESSAKSSSRVAEEFIDPENFSQWREGMEAILGKAQMTRIRLKARKQGNFSKIKELDKLINDLEKEIADFEDSSARNAFESVDKELERISDILGLKETDPLMLAEILETSQIRERLANLSRAFIQNYEKEDSSLLTSFYNSISPEDFNRVASEITRLEGLLNNTMGIIIHGVITNNTYIQQTEILMKEEKGGEEKWERFKEKIDSLLDEASRIEDVDGDKYLGLNFLGINSYDSVFADVVGIMRDMNKAREAGITMQWKADLQTSHNKLRNKKLNGELITELFFQKDEFGQITNNLISKFSNNHFSNLAEIRGLRGDFYRTSRKKEAEKVESYKNWMEAQKEHTDFIDLTRIAKFANTHRKGGKFEEFFEEYNDPKNQAAYKRDMEAYENSLRERLGDITFERLLEEQISRAEDFLEDYFHNPHDEYTRNPLRFVKHFYSEEFNSPDSKGRMIVPHSAYITQLPKLDEEKNFNEQFETLENSGIDGVKDFYISAKNILDYVRESGASAGIHIGHDNILNLSEEVGKNAMAELSTTGKVGAHTASIARSLLGHFYEGRMEDLKMNESTEGKKYSPATDRTFFSGYFDYGQPEAKKLAELYASYPYGKILEEARKLGLTIPKKYSTESKENKSAVVSAMVRRQINKSSSLDLLRRITTASKIAEDINTRLSTKGILNIVRDYTEKRGLKNTLTFLDSWGATNIDKVGYFATGPQWLRKAERKEVKFKVGKIQSKKLTAAEKIVKEAFEAEFKAGNFDGKEYNFKYKGIRYFTNDKKEQLASSEEGVFGVGKAEIETIYEEYVRDMINDLGKHPTLGTIINGIAYSAYKTYLSYSPISGLNNRMQGLHQNNQLAATGLYGFGNDELRRSRRFMTGYFASMFADYVPAYEKVPLKDPSSSMGPTVIKKVQQFKILEHLARSLDYLDNVMEDIRGGEGNNNVLQAQNLWEKVKQFSSDFAMNIPESYNQLEILLSLFQVVTIKGVDEHGNEIESPIFNPETMEFVFEPGSMRLKKEFRTPDNILNWEKFTLASDGTAEQQITLAKANIFKYKSQGNYRSDDSPIFQSTMTGKVSTMFMKWYFENTNAQYGKKKIDLSTAMVDIKGRKVPLLSQMPTLGAYLLLNNLGIVALATNSYALVTGAASLGITGGVIGSALAVAMTPVPVLALAFTGTSLAVALWKNKENLKSSQQDVKLSLAFMTEVVARTVKSSLATASKVVPSRKAAESMQISDKTINKWFKLDDAERWKGAVSLEDRALISGTAQEIADKYNVYFLFALGQLGIYAASVILKALASDDDEEKEKLVERLKFLEKVSNKWMNVRQRQINDLDQFTSATATFDLIGMTAALDFLLDGTDDKVKNSALKYYNGDIDFKEMAFLQSLGILEIGVGVPRKLSNLVKPGTNTTLERMLTDKRVYDTGALTDFDKYLSKSIYSGEDKYKSLVEDFRNSHRGTIKRSVMRKIKNYAKDNNISLDPGKIQSLTDSYSKEVYKNADSYVNKGTSVGKQTYEEIYNNTNKAKLATSLNDIKINLDKKGEMIKKKTSTSKSKKKSNSNNSGMDRPTGLSR